mgnify:CR=1 FL=1
MTNESLIDRARRFAAELRERAAFVKVLGSYPGSAA